MICRTKVKLLAVFPLALALACGVGAAHATVIGIGAFVNPTVIDFNDGNPANTPLGATYAGQGVASTTLCGGQVFATGPAPAAIVARFYPRKSRSRSLSSGSASTSPPIPRTTPP